MTEPLASVFVRLGSARRAPRVIGGVVIAVFAGQLLATVAVGGVAALFSPGVLPGLAIHSLFVVGIVGGAVRLARSDLSHERYPRLLGWYLSGIAAFVAINLAIMVLFPMDRLVVNVGWLAFSANMGAGGGLVAGWTEARAIDRAVAAEREAAATEFLATQRDRFEYMNALLRHEVLNNVQVIRGQAEYLLTDERDPEVERRLEIVSRQAADMAAVVEDVRVVSQGLTNTDLEAMDLEAILREELTDVRDSHDRVETELSCPPDVEVVGDSLLRRVFSNLFTNAVEHNDAAVPRVAVDVTVEEDAVAVRVADNGPGIPEGSRDSLFDRSSGPHGIGLYLVDTLVSHYGGSVELSEAGPEGSTFTIELRRATGEAGAQSDATASIERAGADGQATTPDG